MKKYKHMLYYIVKNKIYKYNNHYILGFYEYFSFLFKNLKHSYFFHSLYLFMEIVFIFNKIYYSKYRIFVSPLET